MPSAPFPFADFERARTRLHTALADPDEVYLLLTGDTGTGKTALMRQLQASLDRCRFRDPEEAKRAVFEYIEGWYNPHRRHSSIDYYSPMNYEKAFLNREAKYSSQNLSTETG